MKDDASGRLLSIGEFAAATQLSLKALRLYDEQRLLRPATIDAANGYRYYRHDQISVGRLIRLLRDMELPLAAIADIVGNEPASAEAALRQYAQDLEQRFARQRRAFRTALAHLRNAAPTEAPAVTSRGRPSDTVAVWPFLAERRSVLQRIRTEAAAAIASLERAGIETSGEPICVLLDPLSDEEGRLELHVPIPTGVVAPHGLAIRQRPPADCAVIVVEFAAVDPIDLTAGIDTLFDWFDRHGRRALEAPAVAFTTRSDGISAEIQWAYA